MVDAKGIRELAPAVDTESNTEPSGNARSELTSIFLSSMALECLRASTMAAWEKMRTRIPKKYARTHDALQVDRKGKTSLDLEAKMSGPGHNIETDAPDL